MILNFSAGSSCGGQTYSEAPGFTTLVEAGELPPVDERLPDEPLVVELGLAGLTELVQ